MEALRLILRYVHLIGFALLLGGAIVQYISGKLRINPAMLWGSVIMLADRDRPLRAPARRRRAGPRETCYQVGARHTDLCHGVLLRKRDVVNRGHFLAIVGLTLVANAAVAVFWR